MAFANNTPGRSRQITMMGNLHDDALLCCTFFKPGQSEGELFSWSAILRGIQERSGYVKPTETDIWDLPNDKGALVQLGTTRLPLQRHDAADVLWRLWGVDITEGFTHDAKAAQSIIKDRGQAIMQVYTKHLAFQFRYLFEGGLSHLNPTQFDETAVRSTYLHQAFLFARTKNRMLGFYSIFIGLYQDLVNYENVQPRPLDVPSGNWLEDIVAKRRANWILPLSDQIAASTEALEKAKALHSPLITGWYLLHAIYLLMPWWPMEWYMAQYEAHLTGLQGLVQKIIAALIHFAPPTANGACSTESLPGVLLDIPFTTVQGARLIIRLSIERAQFYRQHEALMESTDDEMVKWREAHPPNEPRLWPNSLVFSRLRNLEKLRPWRSTEAGDFSILEACSMWWESLDSAERKKYGCHLCPTCIAIKWIKRLKAAGKTDPWTMSIPELIDSWQTVDEKVLGYY